MYPEYEIQAWFGFAGSTAIPLTKRPGEFAASESSRVNVTLPGVGSFAFDEMNTRPVPVATHIVPVFCADLVM